VNAGIAFYGSILSALVWWLVALYCATLLSETKSTHNAP
jgi:hypothetical protein